MNPLNNSLFSSAPPHLSPTDIQAFVEEHYGLKISPDIVVLGSERDQNALVTVEGQRLIFRVTNRAEPRPVTALQTAALKHIQEKSPAFPSQHLVATRSGRTEALLPDAQGGNVVRLMTYLSGTPLSSIAHRTSTHRELAGEALGELSAALRDFSHEAAEHELIWNVAKAGQIRELFTKIDDPERRGLATYFLDQFEKHAASKLGALRSQVIHNDLNPHNILFDSSGARVSGVLDFGDIIYCPVVVDIAVAASSHMTPKGNPLAGPADVVRGFHSVVPLEAGELELLFDLMAVRLVLSVAITGWRASLYPNNREYILKNNAISWATLEAFYGIDRRMAADFFRACCRQSEVKHA